MVLVKVLRAFSRNVGKRGVVLLVAGLSSFHLVYELVLVPLWLNWQVAANEFVVQVTLRGLALCFLLANWSVNVQADGLAGATGGLFPLPGTLHSLSLWVEDYPRHASHNFVSLLLAKSTLLQLRGQTLVAHSRTAVAVALLGLFYPHPVALAYLYLNYYATRRVLPEMFSLQWDVLLCESGLLGALLAAASHCRLGFLQHAAILLFKLLAFRLFFGSGVVKLTSGDVAWRQCSALGHHFLTQPLPGRLAPRLHALDKDVQTVLCFAALMIETVLPLLALTCNTLSVAAAVCFAALQLAIMAAGSFGFFNLLCLVLCAPLCNIPGPGPGPGPGPAGPEAGVGDFGDGAGAAGADSGAAAGLVGGIVLLLAAHAAAALLLGHGLALAALLTRSGFLPSAGAGASADAGVGGGARSSSSSTDNDAPPTSTTTSSSTTSTSTSTSASTSAAASAGRALRVLHGLLQAAGCCGHYGLFATMTTVRDEVEVELRAAPKPRPGLTPGVGGKAGGKAAAAAAAAGKGKEKGHKEAEAEAEAEAAGEGEWKAVRWRCKPSHPHPRGASWPPLHMPRVDWRLWFVSLALARQLRGAGAGSGVASTNTSASASSGDAKAQHPQPHPPLALPAWLTALLIGLLERQPAVLSLLHPDQDLPPLPLGADGQPMLPGPERPGQERVRVRLVRYTFTPPPPPPQPSQAQAQAQPREETRGRGARRWDEEDSDQGAAAAGSDSDSGVDAASEGEDEEGNDAEDETWTVSYPRTVLPPSSLEELYLTGSSSSSSSRGAPQSQSLYGKPAKMRVETAADIIQRTIAAAGHGRRKKED